YSAVSKDTLKPKLLQLQCHFTWGLRKEDIDIMDLEGRLNDQIQLSVVQHKVTAYNLLSYLNRLKGDNEEALRNLQKAEEIIKEKHGELSEGTLIVLYGNYAWTYYYMNRLTDTQAYLDKLENICRKFPQATRYTVNLPAVYGEKGWSLLKFGRKYYEQAKQCFEDAIKEDPDNSEWNSGYAIVLYRQLRHVLELNPEDTVAMVLLGLKLQEFKQDEEAFKYIEQALEKSPDLPYVTRYVAKFLRIQGCLDKSLQLLQRALQITPNSGFLHHQVSLCYKLKFFRMKAAAKHQRNYTEQTAELLRCCIYHFEKTVKIKPSFMYAQGDLANMYGESREYQKADKLFENLFKLEKMNAENQQSLHFLYGTYQLYQKRSEADAIPHFKKVLEISNDSNLKHRSYLILKKLAAKQIDRDQGNGQAFGILGWIHKIYEEKQEAIECYEKALQCDPGNEDYLSALCELRLSI
uniref:Interferon-induced protein with tetratricopeptide repeats 10 n=1 Tax=Latimeria chalumnae TaxID=7897 RepID=H3A6B7_LATCH